MGTGRLIFLLVAFSLVCVQICAQTSNKTTSTVTTTTVTTAKTSPETTSAKSSVKSSSPSSTTSLTTTKTPENSTTTVLTSTVTKTTNTTTSQVTTQPTSTTAKPEPENTWYLKGPNGTICLKLQAHATFDYKNGPSIELPSNATVDNNSSCDQNSSDHETLTLKWENFEVTFVFMLADSKKFYLHYLKFTNRTDDHEANFTDKWRTDVGKSYLCDKDDTVQLSNDVTVKFSKIQVEAFGNSNSTEFGAAEECSTDNEIIPIAVGCALAGLVVVVLIAYLVGRRRSRQKGYQSV